MNKIKYPKTIKGFHSKYIELFPHNEMQADLNKLIKSIQWKKRMPSVEEILLMPIEALLSFSTSLNARLANKKQTNKKKNIFNYDNKAIGKTFQSDIATFFTDAKEPNLAICYFCGLDHVYSFRDLHDYADGMDLLRNGSEKQWLLIQGITPRVVEKILNQKDNKKSINEFDIPEAAKQGLKELIAKKRNHFTLDHVLDKATHPIAALSLYNLVPSCYPCNSKFKSIKDLISDQAHCVISPTSANFKLHQQAKFRLYFNGRLHSNYNSIHQPSDFVLNLELPKGLEDTYDRFLEIFKIRARYVFHKKHIVSLIEKSRKYDQTQIDKLAHLLKIPAVEIKEDIYGSEIFDPENNSVALAKLKRDIATQIGIIKLK